MKIHRYNPANMSLISEDTSTINIGNIAIGNYNNEIVAIQLDPEGSDLEELAFFLENKNNLNHTSIKLFKSSIPVSGILPNDSRLDTILQEAHGVSDIIQFSDKAIILNENNPEYIYLSTFVGIGETNLGNNTINFRFVFEYV